MNNPVDKHTLEDVVVLVPMHNEEDVIAEVISGLQNIFANIVVLDDGSTDRSAMIVRELGVRVISHAVNLGQGAAIKTLFDYICSLDHVFAVITFDADGQHSPEDAEMLAREIIECEEDVIFGTRFLEKNDGVPLLKKLVLKIATQITNALCKVCLSDTHNGLKALKVSAIKNLALDINGYAFESQLVMEVGTKAIKYKEMKTYISYTDYSVAKGQSLRNSLVIAEDIINLVRLK